LTNHPLHESAYVAACGAKNASSRPNLQSPRDVLAKRVEKKLVWTGYIGNSQAYGREEHGHALE